MAMLDDLLSIKRRREDDATAAVGEANRSLDAALDARRAKEKELAEYIAWKQAENARLFEEVCKNGVSRSELENYRERTGLLRQRHLQLQQELRAAGRKFEAAESRLEQARRQRLYAHREVVKFKEFKRVIASERQVEAERREEAETEDIVSGQRGGTYHPGRSTVPVRGQKV